MHDDSGASGLVYGPAFFRVGAKLESLGMGQSQGDSQGSGAQATAKASDGSDVGAILQERGARYGKFIDHSGVAQRLKTVMRNHMGERWANLADDQKEGLEMIAHKLARIVNGDPDYADSWVDIAGYSKLVADRLQGVAR